MTFLFAFHVCRLHPPTRSCLLTTVDHSAGRQWWGAARRSGSGEVLGEKFSRSEF